MAQHQRRIGTRLQKSKFNIIGETTNNRLESINSKVKSVCSRFATLDQFFDEFFCVLATLRNERNYKAVMASIKHPTALPAEEYVRKYQEILTPYAYQMFVRQHSALHTVKLKSSDSNKYVFESSAGEVMATTATCSCYFGKATGLPCKHIITVRSKSSMNPFDKDLVPARWTKDSYTLHLRQRFEGKVDFTSSTGIHTLNSQTKPKILDHFEKYNTAKKVCLKIASAMSYNSHERFLADLKVMQDILKYLEQGLALPPLCGECS